MCIRDSYTIAANVTQQFHFVSNNPQPFSYQTIDILRFVSELRGRLRILEPTLRWSEHQVPRKINLLHKHHFCWSRVLITYTQLGIVVFVGPIHIVVYAGLVVLFSPSIFNICWPSVFFNLSTIPPLWIGVVLVFRILSGQFNTLKTPEWNSSIDQYQHP